MKQLLALALTLCVGFMFSMSMVTDAEAKRLGGGNSFGSKPSQTQTAKRSATNTNTTAAPNKAQQQNDTRKQELSKKGGMMGLLGGLMIGGLLGALFFGGAFENINFMDILLFAGIAFLLFKLFTRRKQVQPAVANGAPMDFGYEKDNNQYREALQNFGSGSKQEPENILETGKIPKGFDSNSFLKGAENVYYLLQNAWDKKELGDLREFCTDHVFAELQDQIRSRTGDNRTEVISLKSELVNVVTNGNSTEATVVFNAELREFDNDAAIEPPVISVQEAWHFLRPNNRQEHVWLLDAIQQLED